MTSTYIFNILGYLAIGKILIIATSNLLLATINSFFRLQLCVKKEKVKNPNKGKDPRLIFGEALMSKLLSGIKMKNYNVKKEYKPKVSLNIYLIHYRKLQQLE